MVLIALTFVESGVPGSRVEGRGGAAGGGEEQACLLHISDRPQHHSELMASFFPLETLSNIFHKTKYDTGDMSHETIMVYLILWQWENQIASAKLPGEALSDHIKSHPDREWRFHDSLCPSRLRAPISLWGRQAGRSQRGWIHGSAGVSKHCDLEGWPNARDNLPPRDGKSGALLMSPH